MHVRKNGELDKSRCDIADVASFNLYYILIYSELSNCKLYNFANL